MGDERLAGFPPRTVDKVERLLDLLVEMGEHPLLRGKLALHGGTALNLFMLDIPRLSVDIDVSYIGALDRDEMFAERPLILGYFTDNRMTANPRVKGGEARTRQMEFKGRAERRIEREGGYSWVADIRSHAQTARALAHDEASYRGLLETLGVELSLNSPNARRRDYLYALADHPPER